mmetsp:Transcript_19078/g.16909  ORF Transcript_19078/g.16909 Transcript_19078/m.16909 type:complete len:189 (-) Transcript_19078:379-945(-)
MRKVIKDPFRSRNIETKDTLTYALSTKSRRLVDSEKENSPNLKSCLKSKIKKQKMNSYRDTFSSFLRKERSGLVVSSLTAQDVFTDFPLSAPKIDIDPTLLTYINFLRQVLNFENRIEKCKIELSTKPDYTSEAGFAIFEYEDSGFIYHNDISTIAVQLGVEVDETAVQLFVYRHDHDKDGRLNFYEF